MSDKDMVRFVREAAIKEGFLDQPTTSVLRELSFRVENILNGEKDGANLRYIFCYSSSPAQCLAVMLHNTLKQSPTLY